MNVPIKITDEFENDEVVSDAFLNLDSGEITGIKFPTSYDIKKNGLPFKQKDYNFTYGILSKDNKDMEFAVDVSDGSYSVTPNDLDELKKKSILLFTGGSSSQYKNKF